MRLAARTRVTGPLCWVLLIALSGTTASAGQVVATNFRTGAEAPPSHPVVWNRVLAPNGTGTVAVGTFSGVSDAQISVGASNPTGWAAVLAGFQQLGTSTTVGGAAALNNAGMFRLTVSAVVEADSPFLDRPIYVVAGNGPTLASSSMVIIFKSSRVFPSDSIPGPATEVSITGDPEGTFLIGRLAPPQVLYTSGAFAHQWLRPISSSWGEDPDPYGSWISQFSGLSEAERELTADPDADGFVNGQEYFAGTLPNDSASALSIRSVNLLPDDVTVVTWNSVAGKTYRLLASHDGVAFSQVGSATATGALQSFVLNTPRPASWFFKVSTP